MFHDAEGFHRLSADALGGRVRSEELRIFLLQPLQLSHQLIVFGVANLGAIQHVIAMVVMIYPGLQPLNPLFYLTYIVHKMPILYHTDSLSSAFTTRFTGHSIIAFDTTDNGLVYFEPQSDWIARPVIGKRYYQCVEPEPDYYYTAPPHDDTIMDILVIW